jgi:hypothetical protein
MRKKRKKGIAMSESNDSASAEATKASEEAPKAPEAATAPATEAAAAAGPSLVTKLKAHPKVQHAITVAKEHPLGAVVGVAAAVAFVEVEFAVGILTGIGATALLAAKSGPEARKQVVTSGKQAWSSARERVQKARKPKAAAEAAPPPPAP